MTPRLQHFVASIALVTSILGVASAPVPAGAISWANAATAAIHPGVQTYTNGSQCTANFVFTNGGTVYIGQAAHCSSTGSNTQTDGCTTDSRPLGTLVTILGASKPGVLVYNSWLTMQHVVHETDADTCAANDLALVMVDPADVAYVNPTLPVWGGPAGMNATGTTAGDNVYSYGNSILRLGVTLVAPKIGMSNGDTNGGWSHDVTMVTPGIPGDSGSAYLDRDGRALGDLSTISVAIPGGVSNNVSDLTRELNYLHAHEASLAGVQLALGTLPFKAGAVPLDINRPVTDPVGGLRNFFGF